MQIFFKISWSIRGDCTGPVVEGFDVQNDEDN